MIDIWRQHPDPLTDRHVADAVSVPDIQADTDVGLIDVFQHIRHHLRFVLQDVFDAKLKIRRLVRHKLHPEFYRLFTVPGLEVNVGHIAGMDDHFRDPQISAGGVRLLHPSADKILCERIDGRRVQLVEWSMEHRMLRGDFAVFKNPTDLLAAFVVLRPVQILRRAELIQLETALCFFDPVGEILADGCDVKIFHMVSISRRLAHGQLQKPCFNGRLLKTESDEVGHIAGFLNGRQDARFLSGFQGFEQPGHIAPQIVQGLQPFQIFFDVGWFPAVNHIPVG